MIKEEVLHPIGIGKEPISIGVFLDVFACLSNYRKRDDLYAVMSACQAIYKHRVLVRAQTLCRLLDYPIRQQSHTGIWHRVIS